MSDQPGTEENPKRYNIPSNTELAQRLARVESNIEHVDTKLDHQQETLELIAEHLGSGTKANTQMISEIKNQHKRLWFTHQAMKWVIGLLMGGSLTVYVLMAL